MTQLFERRCVLIVFPPPTDNLVELRPEAIRFEGLRVQFKIQKTSSKEPNSAELAVYNLADRSRAFLQTKGVRVVLQAGYVGNVANIFSGDVRHAQHVRDGASWVTKIQSGDGERAYQHAEISESFAPGTPVKDVIVKLVTALGVDAGNARLQTSAITDQYVNGFVADGKAANIFDRLLRNHGYEWSIQDGRIQVLNPGETTKETAAVLSPSSGLIGSPEIGTPGERGGPAVTKLRSLLQPALRPGGRVELRTTGKNSQLRVQRVTHQGDTAGNDWFSDLECVLAK